MKKENIKNRLLLPVAYENDSFVIYKFSVDDSSTLDGAGSAERSRVK